MELPESYNALKYRERLFVDCYLNESLIEPQTGKHTFNDKFISYVFAYNIEVENFLRFKYTILNFASKEYETVDVPIEGATEKIIVTDAKKYLSVIRNSSKIYNRVVKAINDIRLLMYDSQDKSRVLELKDAIYNSSISAKDFKDRNENRKMAMKIFGLDQIKIDVTPDIYSASGKNILQGLRKSEKKEDSPIIPVDINSVLQYEEDDSNNDDDNEGK